MSTRKAVFPDRPHALYRQHGYSPAIQSGDLLFVSGMVGAREDGTPEPDLEAQIRLAFEHLKGVLEKAGCTFDDVVDVTLFLTHPEASAGLMIQAMARAFPREPKPNATAVGVNWLAGFEFEIKVIARVPQS
jgi:enamine deaminase RidA (YjgF/YER057c/UK114 family)